MSVKKYSFSERLQRPLTPPECRVPFLYFAARHVKIIAGSAALYITLPDALICFLVPFEATTPAGYPAKAHPNTEYCLTCPLEPLQRQCCNSGLLDVPPFCSPVTRVLPENNYNAIPLRLNRLSAPGPQT